MNRMDKGSGLRPDFWDLPLHSLSKTEWEALCDGCGRCCLKKFQDEEAGEILWTRVICRYYDQESKLCGCYSKRTVKVPDCVNVKALDLSNTDWMPDTCAYKLRALEKPLFPWHPLIAGSSKAMDEAGISVTGKVVSEDYVHPQGYEEHVIRWINADN